VNPTKLYVGNLPYSVTSDQLGQKFAAAGEVVSASVISDKFSGRSRGFGFVEYASEEAAHKAIEMFNNQNFGDGDTARPLVVNIAREPKARDGQGFDRPKPDFHRDH